MDVIERFTRAVNGLARVAHKYRDEMQRYANVAAGLDTVRATTVTGLWLREIKSARANLDLIEAVINAEREAYKLND